MALRLSIVHISRKTIRKTFLILSLPFSPLYLLFFYLKNILIASSLSSGIVIGLDGRSRGGGSVGVVGREFDDCTGGRGVGEGGKD
jgi:hypothetical protein